MGQYSIHFSPTGGTRRVADILVEGLRGEYNQIDLCHETDDIDLSESDVCLVSVPSYGGRVPAVAIDRLILLKIYALIRFCIKALDSAYILSFLGIPLP